MSSEATKKLIVIVGPTAIGKTDLAIRLALQLDTEIVSADSRQFYREMSIGTAKPTAEELKMVKHHFINSLSIHEEYSAGDFETDGMQVIERLLSEKQFAILVGGSGLFIKAITEGFDDLPRASREVREDLNNELALNGISFLQDKLKELDPSYYQQVDLNNPQRIIRGLEVCISTKKPFSSFLEMNRKKARPFTPIFIGLNTQRDALYHRINQRVDKMIEDGLLDEVKELFPYRNLNALNTVGYTEIFNYLDHKSTLEGAIHQIKQNTRRFAKRQLTWFRKNSEIRWFEPDQKEEITDYICRES